jgi:hypothetical protein
MGNAATLWITPFAFLPLVYCDCHAPFAVHRGRSWGVRGAGHPIADEESYRNDGRWPQGCGGGQKG